MKRLRSFCSFNKTHPLTNTILGVKGGSEYIYYPNKGNHLRGHNNFLSRKYDEVYQFSRDNPVDFWDQEGRKVEWFKPYTTVLDHKDTNFPKWFPDGEINICYNALDANLKQGRGK